MYALLFLSVISIGACIERWWFFRKSSGDGDSLGDKLCDLLEKGNSLGAQKLLDSNTSIEAQVVRRGIRWVDGGPEALADSIESEMMKKRKELERGMNFLGTLGNNAPFIGLFGTVIGVIEAFHQLGAGQDKAAMGNVMNGIAEALVATGVGLFVAIPAVIAFNVFQKRVASVEDNVAAISKQLTALLKAAAHARMHSMLMSPPEPSNPYADAAAENGTGSLHHLAESQWDGVE
jgi:biopolymer transport protein ExbB/TolQ